MTITSNRYVIRTWVRDGSENVMPLAVACENLRGKLGKSREQIEGLLLSGEALETKHATYQLYRGMSA